MEKEVYTTPKIITHQSLVFETAASGPSNTGPTYTHFTNFTNSTGSTNSTVSTQHG